jgi:hypothetical protein
MNNIKSIRNGSLYFNEGNRKVERVLGAVNTQRVWTKRHKQPARDTQIKELRLAKKSEVDNYLGIRPKAEPSFPPLPTLPTAPSLPPLPKAV